MKSKLTWFAIILWLLTAAACNKNDFITPGTTLNTSKPVCFDCGLLENNYRDSLDAPTLLGRPVQNPYLIPNMTIAYKNVYEKTPKSTLPVTHLYVKFSPANYAQLDKLEEEDIDLFNYPLHLELISEGDYYVAPGKQIEDIPDYYAVVEISYKFPQGIQYTVIDKMNIPDNDPAWENEALRLTGNLGLKDEYPPGYYNPKTIKSIPEDPPVLNQDNNTPVNNSHHPSGIITVQNELLSNHGFRGVSDMRVVIRRLFKVEKLYTNDAGEFQATKYFKNKYTIVAKFKDHYARIARMRPWAIHEQFFPIKINFGKWDDLDYHHEFRIPHPNGTGTTGTSHWCAAVAYNGIREFHAMCKEEYIAEPQDNLNILLSSKRGSGNGNTYMLNKILKTSSAAYGTEAVAAGALLIWSPAGAAIAVLSAEVYKARGPDIKYGYGGDASYLTTDRYSELVYHELSHASHYTRVGNNWWLKFGIAELKNPGEGSYGSCCTEYAPRIALGEGWAFFIGHYFSDKKWKLQSTPFPEQGFIENNRDVITFSSINELSSHIIFLESYDPHRRKDPSAWVPKGLLYDLSDPIGEFCAGNAIRDSVSGYQPRQFFNAMLKDVESMDEFRNKLLQQNMNYQKEQVTELFRQYGY